MKVYLAARFSRKMLMREVREKLRAMGYEVTSRWIDSPLESSPDEPSPAPESLREQCALDDLRDIVAADIVISYTESTNKTGGRGGRHVEFGVALALEKLVIIVGPRENVFHYLPEVTQFETFDRLYSTLAWLSDPAVQKHVLAARSMMAPQWKVTM